MDHDKARPRLLVPPSARLCRGIPLHFVSRGHRGGRKTLVADLNLSSLVGMLSVLTIFLILNFHASGETGRCRVDPPLPEAVNFKDLEQAPIITIRRDGIQLNGDDMADVSQEDGYRLHWQLLRDNLIVLKNNFKLLHPDPAAFRGQVILEADRSLTFSVIKAVMDTCAHAGYGQIHFIVQQRG